MAAVAPLSLLAAFKGDALLSAGAVAAAATTAAHLGGVWLCAAAPPPGASTATARARRPRLHGPGTEVHFLLCGGARHLVLQALSMALWVCALLVAAPVLAARWHGTPSHPHAELLCAAAAVAAYCALLFQLKALLAFEPSEPPPLLGRALRAGSASLCWDVSRLPSRTARAYICCAIGLLWVGLGGALLLATELLSDATSLAVYYALAAACVTTGAFTTHGLAGWIRYGPVHRPSSSSNGSQGGGGSGSSSRAGASASSSPSAGIPGDGLSSIGTDEGGSAPAGWRFWQPFRGGTAFVMAQALGWALYSGALVACLWLLGSAVAGVAYCVRCWAMAAGLVMFCSELLLAGSLLTFQAPRVMLAAKHMAAGRPSGLQLGAAAWWRNCALDAVVISLLYVPMHIFCAAAALTFLVLPSHHAAALWVGGLFVYYSLTSFGQPEHTGRREWPAMQAWLGAQLERFLPAWLGSCEVVVDGGKETAAQLDPARGRFVFGLHHHGLYPLGAGYLPLLPAFRRLVSVRPTVLTASVCVIVPLLRDIVLWLGVRIVSRRTFEHTLAQRGAVLICPGGQAEMCLTNRLHRRREYAVYSRHKGFVRVALRQGASLVPVLALGEADSLRNLIEWPALQRWCIKKLGFPIPFVIAGRWGLPLPAPTGLKFVVGAPLAAPPLATPGEPSEAEVDAQHERFYAALADLWGRHAPSFPGYADVKLVVV